MSQPHPASALRALRELERARLQGSPVTGPDVGAVLPHIAASPGVARGFAAGVAQRLEGNLLPMQARQDLLGRAEAVGISRFEANLLIAAVQNNRPTMKLFNGMPPERLPLLRSGLLRRWWLPILATIVLQIALLVSYASWRWH